MSFTVVIPARYASTRLPGKPLLMMGDKPMIQHVYEQASASAATQVIVATDDQRIADRVTAFGGEVCLTATSHLSGTDRIQEVAQRYQFDDEHIVVNVQGDEPLIPPVVIDQVASNLRRHPQAVAATLSEPVTQPADINSPHVVKVVCDQQQMALYFSRAAIPYPRNGAYSNTAAEGKERESLVGAEGYLPQRHIGIYAYRVALLHRFVEWSPALLEMTESLEQLRILAHGEKIHVQESCETVPGGVDTLDDFERIKSEYL